jgi:hypothetical protein
MIVTLNSFCDLVSSIGFVSFECTVCTYVCTRTGRHSSKYVSTGNRLHQSLINMTDLFI